MPELPEQARKPRTPAEVRDRLKQLLQQRSDGTISLSRNQKALDRAIDILTSTIDPDQAVKDWLDGGEDFDFD